MSSAAALPPDSSTAITVPESWEREMPVPTGPPSLQAEAKARRQSNGAKRRYGVIVTSECARAASGGPPRRAVGAAGVTSSSK